MANNSPCCDRAPTLLIGMLAAISMSACSGGTPDSTPAAATAGAAAGGNAGARIYAQNCVPCHREDGVGVPSVYPSLVNSAVVNGDSVELAQWVLRGQRPPAMPAGRYSTQMLLFGWLKDADAAALLTFVRSNFGNASPPVDAATVAKAR